MTDNKSSDIRPNHDDLSPGSEAAVEVVRREMQNAIDSARREAQIRTMGPAAQRVAPVRQSARENVARMRGLTTALSSNTATVVEHERHMKVPETLTDLSPAARHTLDRLLSAMRHKAVQVCFYYLKPHCPSLIDAYSEELRDNVRKHIKLLPEVKREITVFFESILEKGAVVGDLIPEVRRRIDEDMTEFERLAENSRDQLGIEVVRQTFAERVPHLIDAIMSALQSIHTLLNETKILVATAARSAVDLQMANAATTGLQIDATIQQTPRVYGDLSDISAVFNELIHNAVKYSDGTQITLKVATTSDRQFVECTINDDGQGMDAETLAQCTHRGESKAGTGEGLAMIVDIVERDLLGVFTIDSAPGKGTTATVRIPLKYTPRRRDES